MTEPIPPTPTLNNAQRDGIRALRFAAHDLSTKLDAEWDGAQFDDERPSPTVALLRAGVPVHGRVERGDLNGIIAWADAELHREEFPGTVIFPTPKWARSVRKDRHAPALRRLLDDATALLRWVDGAL